MILFNFNDQFIIHNSLIWAFSFENALRVAPAETWLTVYRRRRVRGACWASWMFWVAWTFWMLDDGKMKIAQNF